MGTEGRQIVCGRAARGTFREVGGAYNKERAILLLKHEQPASLLNENQKQKNQYGSDFFKANKNFAICLLTYSI
jgi:hypothetical protein